MHFLPALTLATLATSALAKKLPLPGWDKYAEERGFAGHEDPREFGHGGLQAREAEPEAIESWEQAHGSKAAVYKPYGEQESFGQHAARSEEVLHADHHGPGREPAGHHARSAPEHYGHPSEGFHGGEHHARSVPGTAEGHYPGDKYYAEYHSEHGSHHARDAEARMPFEQQAAVPLHRPHQARDTEPRLAHEQHAAEPFHRPHQARDAEDRREQQEYFSWLAHVASHAAAPAPPSAPQGWKVQARGNAGATTRARVGDKGGRGGDKGGKGREVGAARKTGGAKLAGGWGFPW
ncbi:hypothetical protein LTR35_004862 [Friedmanniomyces endolithicus]|uniref:Uncharacterized protein n=1 Tax=Friedmanniomyces endolithicus TaxID=329885 RepID=A0AAN6FBY3_9PEZI|nr:hypothetical protein LTS00_017790 [Friedmanniomyces endolithicus]KAK0286427.1 hypothetical protein LTR35_004862 [Friedmanniomyces endolithicus]KAK0310896.1 hypothetical protein LTR82_014643 [Friedmanniomyces endolithicus]KAK1016752.1 hypothetical protein LTR54_002792 [Friedmanniomyces endolithicus]